MKHIGKYVGAIAILALPAIALAQTADSSGTIQTLITIEDNSKILETVSLWATLIVALSTTVMVWNGGRKMHGGVFGRVLTFFSLGMSLVFLGFVTEISWFQSFDHLYIKMIHDSFYIIGYIMMGIAASKLLRVIKGE